MNSLVAEIVKQIPQAAYNLCILGERVAVHVDGVFYVIDPEWLLEFATQVYWVLPVVDYWVRGICQ